jgi:hypothetical protein
MRVDVVRSFAALLGLTLANVPLAASGQDSSSRYVSPSEWSNFNMPPSASPATVAPQPALTPLLGSVANPLNAPSPVRPASGTQEVYSSPELDGYSVNPDSHDLQPTPMPHGVTSPYREALNAPWSDCDPGPSICGPSLPGCGGAPAAPPLLRWFGGGNVLLWNMADESNRRLFIRDGMPSESFSTSDVSPSFTTGYDLFVGRYLDCGRYGLSVNYLNFNPGIEEVTVVGAMPGAYYAAMPHWDNISLDHDGDATVDTVYDIYEEAAAHRIRRDVSIQGLEFNLSSFGLMGANRIAPPCNSRFGSAPISRLRDALCPGRQHSYTTAGGLLGRGCGGPQIVTSHGFRWFQFEDEFQFAASDADDGFNGATDMFYDTRATNDLYGYQFGGRMIYCLTPRILANFGAKGGIYGNDVFVQQRLGTSSAAAYPTADPTMVIDTSDRDVLLAGLGEVDLGLGYRLNSAWLINGGYRMLYASGVATSVGSIATEYYSVAPSARVAADDSLLLHGAYVGASLNW